MEGNTGYFITRNEVRSAELLMEEGLRPDFREPLEPRELQIEMADKACIIRLGKTVVSCTIVATQVMPLEERPSEGFFQITLSSTHRLDQNFRAETINALRDIIRKNRALDTESLVITIGKLVWDLRAEVVILENDGGLFEAMTLAVLGGLLSTKLPGPRGLRPLVIHHLPIGVTFAFTDPRTMFLDPCVVECEVATGFMTIFTNAQGDICSIRKNGGVPLLPNMFDICIQTAMDICRVWHKALMDVMGKDAPAILKNLTMEKEKEDEGAVPVVERFHENDEVEPEENKKAEEEDTDEEEEAVDLSGLMAIFDNN